METGRMSEGCAGWSPGLLSSSAKGKSGEILSGNHIAHRGPDNHPCEGPPGRFFRLFFQRLTDFPPAPGTASKRAPARNPRRGENEVQSDGRRSSINLLQLVMQSVF